MAYQKFNNGESLNSIRTKINNTLTDLDTGKFGVTRWRDFIVPENVMRVSAGLEPDKVTLIGTIQKYAFDGVNTTEEMQGSIEINHEYKEGSIIRPHVHWAPSDTNIGNIKWQMAYSIHRVGEAPDNEVIISGIGATDGLSKKHFITPIGDGIDGTSLQIGDYIHFRFFRIPTDNADTYAHDAFLLGIGVHYEVDSTGSLQETIK